MFRPGESAVVGLPVDREEQLYWILDPGLCFAAVLGQKDRFGALRYFREIVMRSQQVDDETLLNRMGEEILRITKLYYADFEVAYLGDPYASRKQIASQLKTEYDLLYDNFKMRVQSSYMYDIPSHERRTKRIELLSDKMSLTIEANNKPAVLIDPHGCPLLYEAFCGKYQWETNERGEPTGEILKKNHPYNDVVDCAGMLAIKAFYSKRNTQSEPKIRKRRIQWRRSGTGRSGTHG
jgi:hypothetical protein